MDTDYMMTHGYIFLRKAQQAQYYQCVEDHFERMEQFYDDRSAKQYGLFVLMAKRVLGPYRGQDHGRAPGHAHELWLLQQRGARKAQKERTGRNDTLHFTPRELKPQHPAVDFACPTSQFPLYFF
jgi:hypothetical protein